jgi:hypothetical protein
MRSFRWLALGAAAAAIVGATAASPGAAQAASPPTCGNGKFDVCLYAYICNSYQGSVCTDKDEFWTYYVVKPT